MTASQEFRTAVIAALTERNRSLGRTSLMKLMYFLQELRKVPLGYSYRLYNYGPFDDQVLDDLRVATDLEAVTATPFYWQGGIGYEVRPGKRSNDVVQNAAHDIERYRKDIEWVAAEFGSKLASELEVVSTVVFLDRSNALQRQRVSSEELAVGVNTIKPHQALEKIRSVIKGLQKLELLTAVK